MLKVVPAQLGLRQVYSTTPTPKIHTRIASCCTTLGYYLGTKDPQPSPQREQGRMEVFPRARGQADRRSAGRPGQDGRTGPNEQFGYDNRLNEKTLTTRRPGPFPPGPSLTHLRDLSSRALPGSDHGAHGGRASSESSQTGDVDGCSGEGLGIERTGAGYDPVCAEKAPGVAWGLLQLYRVTACRASCPLSWAW